MLTQLARNCWVGVDGAQEPGVDQVHMRRSEPPRSCRPHWSVGRNRYIYEHAAGTTRSTRGCNGLNCTLAALPSWAMT
ncbi:hypothetical protein XAC3810_660164 [Xanthomonas citri pv. citri]|nr:hypothetical protein XAC3810_660164 [Xanthomonas citri pv. citri]CEE48951.1 hypothetical protein XAC908_950165 [Xanthomonas citri pv. citri]CEE69668.1 hypothetical protein XAC71A_880190 [Xanthomonas citri pv. citri]CEH89915.1 hypothetical protein XACB100_1900036 [Xanthomonas citri pv. citri]CEH92980.1 hypothetical protein XACG117_2000039 [Xanthomonas citri pv. citri]